MSEDPFRPSQEALDSIAELLAAGQQYGIGVTFEPDDIGWRIGYIRGMGGGDLASAYDLQTAAKAALKPLVDLGRRLSLRMGKEGQP